MQPSYGKADILCHLQFDCVWIRLYLFATLGFIITPKDSIFTLANFSQKPEVSSLPNLSQRDEAQLFRSVFQSFASPPSTKSPECNRGEIIGIKKLQGNKLFWIATTHDHLTEGTINPQPQTPKWEWNLAFASHFSESKFLIHRRFRAVPQLFTSTDLWVLPPVGFSSPSPSGERLFLSH